MTNRDLGRLLEACAQIPTDEAVALLVEAREDFLTSGDPASAAVCSRQAILRRVRARDLGRVLPLAEQLARDTGRVDDTLLHGILSERAGLSAGAKEVFEIARERAQTDYETLLVTCFVDQQAAPRVADVEDAGAYASLGDAYFDMGLTADALRTLLVGLRSYHEDWQALDVLVESLVAGKLASDTRPSHPGHSP